MYEKDGEKYFVVDSHSHSGMRVRRTGLRVRSSTRRGGSTASTVITSWVPPEQHWDWNHYLKVTEEDFVRDVFDEGHVDVAIFQSTYLKEVVPGWVQHVGAQRGVGRSGIRAG